MKDIVLAPSAEEAIRSKRVWEFPAGSYATLWWAVKDQRDSFPLLYSICSHAEGPEGDFTISHPDLGALCREIDRLALDDRASNDADLKKALLRLRKLARGAQRRGLSIFGHGD